MESLGDQLEKTLTPHGQQHVLRFWDALDDRARKRLAEQVRSIDFERLERLVNARVLSDAAPGTFDFEPVDVVPLSTDGAARAHGEELLRQGRAACLVVAGGQGTRLGYDAPKGTYPIGALSGKSIFAAHVERLRAVSRRFAARIPLLVMTSQTNDAATRVFFREHDHFGLAPDDLFIFTQGMMPAVDFDGKLILDAPGHIFESPDGHGGVWPALVRSGALDYLRSRGVSDIYHFQVDNVLANVADATFLGLHREASAQMSTKVTRKRDPEEKVGVTVRRADGRVACVEYMDLTDEQAHRRCPDGSLAFWAGNLCIYWYTVDFAAEVGAGTRLPFHLARKKVPYVDDAGDTLEPAEPNGIKFETFVFDALPMADDALVAELDRAEEFAPVKNATGEDSVESARRMTTERFARWLEACGVAVPRDDEGRSAYPIEISPLFALDADELKRKLPKGFAITGPVLL